MKVRNIFLILLTLILSGCGTITITTLAPETATPVSEMNLPDLVVSFINVGMVNPSGQCVDGYQVFTSILNQGTAPAENVTAVETSTGHTITIGRLEAGQKMDLQIPALGNGTYMIVVDPQNVVPESNEMNNNLSYLLPTPTAYMGCAPLPTTEVLTPTPAPFDATPMPISVSALIYADPSRGQVLMGAEQTVIMQGTIVHFSPDGLHALFESRGDLFLAEPMDNPGTQITHSPDVLETAPQWWPANPSKIIFNAMNSSDSQDHNYLGYAAMINQDGSEYQTLGDSPSWTRPAMSPDGKTIAFDSQGWPTLYEIGSGMRTFEPSQYGYIGTPLKGIFFTSPSFSPDGRWLTWWVAQDEGMPQRSFSLVAFDLVGMTNTTLHSYSAPDGTMGWLDNPVWSPNGQWIAFNLRYPDSAGELWIANIGGGIGQRIRLGTNPVWSPDGRYVAYLQWSPQPDVDPTQHISVIEVPSWNIQQTTLLPGSIPLMWRTQ